MKAKRFYIGTSALFLFLLLGVKGLGYHSLSHNQGEEALQCELCTFIVQQESQEFDLSSSCEIPTLQTYIIEDADNLCAIPPYPGRLSPGSLFSRPPPVWV